jgi:hypothetical protein
VGANVTIYGFASGGAQNASAATTVLTVEDTTASPAAPTLLSFGVAASAAGSVATASATSAVRFTGLCFASTSAAAAGTKFSVSASGALSTLVELDYEAQPQGFGLEVQVTDVISSASGSTSSSVFNQPGPLREFTTVLVSVGDVNEAPYWPSGSLVPCAAPSSANAYVLASNEYRSPAPALPNTSSASYVACFYVPENASPADVAALTAQTLLEAADPDEFWGSSHATPASGQSGSTAQTRSYRLDVTNNLAGGAAIFSVGASSRALSLSQIATAMLDFEAAATRSYALSAVVTDASTSAGFSPLSTSRPVALFVLDVNEAPLIAAQACRVQEQTLFNNSPPGTLVGCNGLSGAAGALVASDPDTPFSRWANLSFAITAGNGLGLSSVDAVSGLLSLSWNVTCCSGAYGMSSSLDFESKAVAPVFALTVTVTDGGGLSRSAAVTVLLVDVNEPPVLLAPFSRNITENLVGPQPVGAALGV